MTANVPSIPVLLYHHINNHLGDNVTVDEVFIAVNQMLTQQVQHLS